MSARSERPAEVDGPCNPEKSSLPANDASTRTLSIASGSTISADSRTSTLKYDQEPFERYQHRVEELCFRLWPRRPQGEPRRTTVSSNGGGSGVKARILDVVKRTRWRRVKPRTTNDQYSIERLNGGTYNRVIGVRFNVGDTEEQTDFILRMPRVNMAEFSYIEREVAILRYARQKTTLPVADVISFDPTTSNPLGSGYVIQSRLSGTSLHAIWDDLAHAQRCDAAKQLAKIINSLQDVKHPFPGLIEAAPDTNGDHSLVVRPFEIVSPHDVDWKQKISQTVSDVEIDTSSDGPLQWFGTQFGRWLAHELLADPSTILYWDYQIRVVEVAKQMDGLGFLGDGHNCLCHFDLAVRNILVNVLHDGSTTISGIVDWDSAVFAPVFVSCVPPIWLWTNARKYDAEEGEADNGPLTPEQEEIKELFDETIGFDWTWVAYQPGYRLARELFHFAQHGVPDGVASKRADRFLAAWSKLYDTLMNPEDEDRHCGEAQVIIES